jgi:hypothetical protein
MLKKMVPERNSRPDKGKSLEGVTATVNLNVLG